MLGLGTREMMVPVSKKTRGGDSQPHLRDTTGSLVFFAWVTRFRCSCLPMNRTPANACGEAVHIAGPWHSRRRVPCYPQNLENGTGETMPSGMVISFYWAAVMGSVPHSSADRRAPGS